MIRKVFVKVAGMARTQAKGEFKEWLADALLRGAKAAHKLTKGVQEPEFIKPVVGKDGSLAVTPMEVLGVKRQGFQELWTKKAEEKQITMVHINGLIAKARLQKVNFITPDEFESGLRRGKNGSGLGIDFVERELAKKAHVKAKGDLLAI